MRVNNNITIFNPYLVEHDTVYYGCKISNVWAIYRGRIDLDITAEFNLSRIIVRVPINQAVFSKQYISPIEYETSDPNIYFTFTPGSIVALGLIDNPTATKDELIKQYNALSITKVNDNRYGSTINQHWRLEGV